MDPNSTNHDPSLDLAMATLGQMERAEDSASNPSQAKAPAQAKPAASATNADTRASDVDSGKGPDSSTATKPADGSSPTEVKTTNADPKADKPEGQDQGNGSKFAKNQERLHGSWKELNEEKTRVRTDAEKLKAEKEALEQERQAFQAERQKVQQPKYSPQDYSNAAKAWEAESEKLEAKGEYDEADRHRAMAKTAREEAKRLRENPPAAPVTPAQQTEAFKALQKEWHTKAAIDFPNVVKPGTPEHAAYAQLITSEPSVLNDPKGMYYAARLVAAETSAGKLPTMEKELGELRAKVKALEGKLTINGDLTIDPNAAAGGSSKPTDQQTEKELEEGLRRDLGHARSNWS